MRIISDPALLDFEPFGAPVQNWFRARTGDTLPSFEKALAAGDALAAYREVAVVRHEPLSIMYQQAGEALERLYGKPIAGKSLDQLYNDWFRRKAYEGYSLMIESGQPVYERRMISTVVRKIGYHHLYLPFGQDRVTHAVSYILPTEDAIRDRQDWESMVKATPWLEG